MLLYRTAGILDWKFSTFCHISFILLKSLLLYTRHLFPLNPFWVIKYPINSFPLPPLSPSHIPVYLFLIFLLQLSHLQTLLFFLRFLHVFFSPPFLFIHPFCWFSFYKQHTHTVSLSVCMENRGLCVRVDRRGVQRVWDKLQAFLRSASLWKSHRFPQLLGVVSMTRLWSSGVKDRHAYVPVKALYWPQTLGWWNFQVAAKSDLDENGKLIFVQLFTVWVFREKICDPRDHLPCEV